MVSTGYLRLGTGYRKENGLSFQVLLVAVNTLSLMSHPDWHLGTHPHLAVCRQIAFIGIQVWCLDTNAAG